MNPPASPRERIRRAYFDLIGLPPTFEEVRAFEGDPSVRRWEGILRDLLNRPQYGERWARHWLDVVRYAETNGYERDGPKPEAWRYRDYVIQSFNADKPYDRFIREQIAGDLLYPESREALVATGFYRLHVYDDEPDDSLQADYDVLDDVLSTIGSGILGITLSCARCHDHKFDPISQSEYYQLLDFVHRIEPYGRPHTGGGSRPYGAITRPLASFSEIKAWASAREMQVRVLEIQYSKASETEKEPIKKRLEALKKSPPPFESVLAVSDRSQSEEIQTHRLRRGDPRQPAEIVHAGFPGMATPKQILPENATRVELATWLASDANPMTARVMANRMWQHHFGRGIVSTPNDFGAAGSGATHPQLLDHLASELVQSGWRLKELHFHIMTSRSYQMSSRATQPEGLQADPSNHWFWRQEPRRMDAEVLRDSMLFFSGDLNLRQHGPSVFPELSVEVHQTQDSARKGWGESPSEERNRRSLYIYAKRALPLPLLEAFDAGHVAFSLGQRPVTTVAPQALMLLNDPFMQVQAGRLAGRVKSVRELFQIIWQRNPSDEETMACERMLRSFKINQSEGEPFLHLCLAMLNANETIMID